MATRGRPTREPKRAGTDGCSGRAAGRTSAAERHNRVANVDLISTRHDKIRLPVMGLLCVSLYQGYSGSTSPTCAASGIALQIPR